MGILKNDFMESQFKKFQSKRFQKIADDLNVSLKYIEALDPSIEEDTTNGGVLRGYTVVFKQDGDADIMAKIVDKLEDGQYLHYGLKALDVESDLGYDKQSTEETEKGF